jgi:aspartyl-tRNA(Asn)/glutamyl-tRNA(Gln) amidotransferase subunit A
MARPAGEPAEIGRLRIRFIPRFGTGIVEPEVTRACALAAVRMASLGHHVVETEVPFDVALLQRAGPCLRNASLAWILRDLDWRGQLSERFGPMFEAGATALAVDYVDALMILQTLCEQIALAFTDFDLIMTPAAAAMPWAADESGPAYHSTFPGFANAAGLPGLALPCGFSVDGMPAGFQLVGRLGADWLLVATARAYERAYPWASQWPALS